MSSRILKNPSCRNHWFFLWSLGLAALLLSGCTPSARAQARPPRAPAEGLFIADPGSRIPAGKTVTIEAPVQLRRGTGAVRTPVFTHEGLWPEVPRDLYGLRTVEKPGLPAYDPGSRAFFATANGMVVQVRPDGSLPVVHDGLQGLDIDVRQRAGVVVAREPDLRIVLTRLGDKAPPRVLLDGFQYFAPRFSPDGTRLLVGESRPEGGHALIVDLNGKVLRDLGPAAASVWHPDGRRVVVSRVVHDGERITAGDLYEVEIETGQARCLAQTAGRSEVEPAISLDGQWVAFVDSATGSLYLARYPSLDGRQP